PRGQNPPAGAILDYILPERFSGAVTLEITDAAGQTVRRFSSDAQPEPPKAELYFTELYLGDEPRLSTQPGHHRFVWNLRYERPETLEYEYSIAAVPGTPTAVLPLGPFVLPGAYRIRLSAGGSTADQSLEVAMDPRVKISADQVTHLLEL